MKLIIAGSRSLANLPIDTYELVSSCLDMMEFEVEEIQVVSGGAKGADLLGEQWAYENNYDVVQFIPDWKRPDGSFDKAAGFKRNAAMGQYADAAVVFWDGKSKGAEHMIKVMTDLKKPVSVIQFNENGIEEEEQDPTVTCGYSGRTIQTSEATYVRGYGMVDDDLIVWDYAGNPAVGGRKIERRWFCDAFDFHHNNCRRNGMWGRFACLSVPKNHRRCG